jgi:hypothetical protein
MKKAIFAIMALSMLTAAAYQKSSSGGSWTFKSNRYAANMFIPHSYSLAAFDTTRNPRPKFIIDFYKTFPVSGGKFTVVKGAPKEGQVGIGTGVSQGGVLTFYSSTGGDGKQVVDVTIANGKMTMSGAAIEMAGQTNPKDGAPLTFNISFAQ